MNPLIGVFPFAMIALVPLLLVCRYLCRTQTGVPSEGTERPNSPAAKAARRERVRLARKRVAEGEAWRRALVASYELQQETRK